MDKQTVLSTFETFVDDDLEASIEESLAEQTRIELETELKLQVSKKLDTSKTVVSGSTYVTAYAMQADVLVPSGPHIYVGTDRYTMIPFEQRELYKDVTGYWYVDLFNGNFYLTGSPTAGQTITFPYITAGTTFLEAADDDTILKWPEGFHVLIPMRMAQLFYPIDAGDKTRAWDDRWITFYNQTKNRLIDWDAQWKLAAVGGVTPYGNDQLPPSPDRINDLP